MPLSKKPYELSIWSDNIIDGNIVEQKVATIGTDVMTSQNRALQSKLVCNVNGMKTLTFELYTHYYDNESGEKIENPFIKLITNETKLKLYYDNEWYEFIVKSINENSDNKSFSYTATDLFINELSKTGFEIIFDAELGQNSGTITELANQVIKNTDWTIDSNSENIYQTQKDALFSVALNTSIVAYPFIKMSNGLIMRGIAQTLPSGTEILLSYTGCATASSDIQFIALNGVTPQVDADRTLLNGTQYITENVTYQYNFNYAVSQPTWSTDLLLSSEYRMNRYIESLEQYEDIKLNKVLTKYTDGDDDYWEFENYSYPATNLINNVIANPTDFTNTNGWHTAAWATSASRQLSSADYASMEFATDPDLITLINSGSSLDQDYKTFLKLDFSGSTSTVKKVIRNDSFRATSSITEIQQGQKYVLAYRILNDEGQLQQLYSLEAHVSSTPWNHATNAYDFPNDLNTYLYFDGNNDNFCYINYYNKNNVQITKGYVYRVAEATQSITANDYKMVKSKLQTFLSFINTGDSCNLYELLLFPYVENPNISGQPLFPNENIVNVEEHRTYNYFKDGAQYESLDDLSVEVYDHLRTDLTPVKRVGCPKVRTFFAKESNRFNLLQDLCETFECWMRINVEHNADGSIKLVNDKPVKTIKFVNFLGQNNAADFIYGINVKNITRNLDSNAITTKLIVQPNSNEFAENGSCNIVTAKINPTGENYILNFDYYINQGLLDASEFEKDLYLVDDNYIGLYTQLKSNNDYILTYTAKSQPILSALDTAKSELQIAEVGAAVAAEQFEVVDESLTKWGKRYVDFKDLDPDSELYLRLKGGILPGTTITVERDISLINTIRSAAQLVYAQAQYEKDRMIAQERINQYESLLEQYQSQINTALYWKEYYTKKFVTKYSRFIQEGTWIDEQYTDPNLYYYDGQSVLYESSVPQVSYTINVINLESLEDYSNYKYRLADQTYIQDVEFFGYTTINNIKTPAREKITVTEITNDLDNPDQDIIKVQTYSNSYHDLFQRITATVQQVHYSTGAYEKAAALADADTEYKLNYLTDALNDAAAELTNMGDQTVTWNSQGITVTDGENEAQQLRIVSGAILLTDDGGETWLTGISGRGIATNTLTSGTLNTSVINIMNNNESYFRWDALGITAYDFNLNDDNPTYLNGLNIYKGVRFDRFGIYGYDNIDGSNWHPTAIAAWDENGELIKERQYVRTHSIFELTFDGLYLNLGHNTYRHTRNLSGVIAELASPEIHEATTTLGKVDDFIYNAWPILNNISSDPYYDSDLTTPHFVKVFNITSNNEEQLAMYDDGTLVARRARIQGLIESIAGHIGNWTLDENSLFHSEDGIFVHADAFFCAGGSNNNFAINNAPGSGQNGWVLFVKNSNTDGPVGNFGVTKTGQLYANNARIVGEIITDSAVIGGWHVDNNSLYFMPPNATSYTDATAIIAAGGTGAQLIIDDGTNNGHKQSGWVLFAKPVNATKGNFGVTNQGILYAHDANIAGTITASAGKIGTWVIGADGLSSLDGPSSIGVYLKSDGAGTVTANSPVGQIAGGPLSNVSIRVGNNETAKFAVTTDGVVYASDVKLSGEINAMSGQIANGITFANGLGQFTNGTWLNQTHGASIGFIDDHFKDGIIAGLAFYQNSTDNERLEFIRLIGQHITIGTDSTSTLPQTEYISLAGPVRFNGKVSTNIAPITSNSYDLGDSSHQWKMVYAQGGSWTSARIYKQNIASPNSQMEVFFDNLQPRSFKYKDNSSNRTHYGFIVDEVGTALNQAKLTGIDFGGYQLYDLNDPYGEGGLNYNEFIALNTWQIQQLKRRVAELEARLK